MTQCGPAGAHSELAVGDPANMVLPEEEPIQPLSAALYWKPKTVDRVDQDHVCDPRLTSQGRCLGR